MGFKPVVEEWICFLWVSNKWKRNGFASCFLNSGRGMNNEKNVLNESPVLNRFL